MKMSEAKYKTNTKWIKENYEQINISLPKGAKDKFKNAAKKSNLSLAQYINEAVDEKIQRESGEDGVF